jgi:Holliday junction DNA helicase RuvA
VITGIEGTVADSGPDWLDVAVGGVTVRVNLPMSTAERLGAVGAPVKLLTTLQVRDDSLTLFGFPDREARAAFEMLIGVNGVGPRVALSVLSALAPESLALAVESGDTDAFTSVPGVGKRTASRILLELRGKLDFDLTAAGAVHRDDADVVDALTALGYTALEARRALASLPSGEELPVEEKVRLSLGQLAGE